MSASVSHSRTGIGPRITLIAVVPVIAALAITVATLVVQQQRLDREVDVTTRSQALDEATKVAHSAYLLCVASEQRNQRQLDHSLAFARDTLRAAGNVTLAAETTVWQARHQATGETRAVTLPKLLLGAVWPGQQADAAALPVVDEVTRATGDFCTVFQRMNDAGDMLRVCTSVRAPDGRRAIGTYVPATAADGTPNPVVQSVLRGETYRGRALVLREWHAAAYEPIWDAGHARVIGMLFVGVPMSSVTRELRAAIMDMKVGKTGYVYVIGTKGDERGRYLVSQNGKRDGENIWEAKDASGRLFIQSIVEKALKTEGGSVEHETYPWQNPGEKTPRLKVAAVTHFAPWGWAIGAGVYEEDFAAVRDHISGAERKMIVGVGIVALVVALLAGVVGFVLSRGIVRPIERVIAGVSESSSQIDAAAEQTAGASQSLAEGSSEQAASLEEISASLEEMSGMTKRNAENAGNANNLARLARQAADSGAHEMQAMSAAMQDIHASSDDIAKIIKTIDEIAFQTNILALNAAVEAARAGEAGMGFAVVAEEVRSLAQRSAQAARETAQKIEGAIGKTAQGVQISEKVGQSLAEIVDKVRKVDALVAEVATASNEQSQGVQQINQGVHEMDRVVQTNAAAAEESAAAAHELNDQARALKAATAELRALVDGSRAAAAHAAALENLSASTPSTTPLRHPAPPARRRAPAPAHVG